MFQDEAGFGRINKPKYCWCEKGIRPSVPCHHIREYRYAYGAVEPVTGSSCFLVMPYCNSTCMNIFLEELSKQYPDDLILLCCDGAAWHKSNKLQLSISNRYHQFAWFQQILRRFYIMKVFTIPWPEAVSSVEELADPSRGSGEVLLACAGMRHLRQRRSWIPRPDWQKASADDDGT